MSSYVTRAEADSYFGARLNSGSWASCTTPDAALSSSFNRLNQEYFIGYPTNFTQTGSFPRVGLFDRNGYWISPSIVPQDVKDAQCELALSMIDGSYIFTADTSNIKYDSVAVGPINVNFNNPTLESAGALPDLVVRLLGPYQQSVHRVVRA